MKAKPPTKPLIKKGNAEFTNDFDRAFGFVKDEEVIPEVKEEIKVNVPDSQVQQEEVK